MSLRLRIGLTGGVASGKSTAAGRFRERGVPVVDADEAARAVVAVGTPGLAAVLARFGRGVLADDSSLDRRRLRDLVFADAPARRDLEAILHPLIRSEMERQAELSVGPYLVLAIPLLIESMRSGQSDGDRGHTRVDRILVVDADEAEQVARLVRRDGCSAEQARAILAVQASREERAARADDLLPNLGSEAELRLAVDRLHERYLCLAARFSH